MVPMVVDNDAKTASGLSRKTKAVVLNQSKYHLTGRVWAALCTARFNQMTYLCMMIASHLGGKRMSFRYIKIAIG